MRFILTSLLALWLVAFSAMADDTTPAAQIHYDMHSDRLSVAVEHASLARLLATIAWQSGIEVQFDPAAEQEVSATIKEQPLNQALDGLLRDKSTAFIYSDAQEGAKGLLLGVHVLPKGKTDLSDLRPLVSPVAEAARQSGQGLRGNGQAGATAAMGQLGKKRWDARMQRMSEEKRAALKEALDKRNAEMEKRKAEREQRKAELQAKGEERKQVREQRMAHMRENNPELYALRQQQVEEARQRRAQGIGKAKLNVEVIDTEAGSAEQ